LQATTGQASGSSATTEEDGDLEALKKGTTFVDVAGDEDLGRASLAPPSYQSVSQPS
jgi:hypothetical protein